MLVGHHHQEDDRHHLDVTVEVAVARNLPTTEDLDHQITTDDNKYCVFNQIYHEEEERVKLKKIEMV